MIRRSQPKQSLRKRKKKKPNHPHLNPLPKGEADQRRSLRRNLRKAKFFRRQCAALLMKNISIRRKFQGQARADELPKPMHWPRRRIAVARKRKLRPKIE